jgi:predicted phage-related endonuclease
MSLEIFKDLLQGSDEWLAERCGIVTASVVGLLVTAKTLKPAETDTARGLTNLLAAERITGIVEPIRATADMERGTLDEPYARDKYAEHHAPVSEVGFMVRHFGDGDFKIGFSPDGLVGEDGLIEIKSRAPKKHLATILADEVPAENMAQCQTGLLVSGREWIDYVSYCGGMPLWTKRVERDERWHEAIIASVERFENNALDIIVRYLEATERLPETERIDHFAEMRF